MLCTVLHLLLCILLSARMSRRHRIIAVHLRTNPSGGQARLSGVSAECGGVIWSKTTLFAIDGTARTRWIDRKGYAREAMYLSGTRNLQTDWCWKSYQYASPVPILIPPFISPAPFPPNAAAGIVVSALLVLLSSLPPSAMSHRSVLILVVWPFQEPVPLLATVQTQEEHEHALRPM
ncbi:hypothetical protein BDR03DRAFT_938098 [Suillus americanus]|nr:hypothetical protein BDR03DRAFT_938098 [Suillus americanus]